MSVVNGFQVGSETLKYNYESLENYNTPEFSTSSSKTYTVGDYVMHNGKLYKCTIATTGGTWDVNNWEEAILTEDYTEFVDKVNDVLDIMQKYNAFDLLNDLITYNSAFNNGFTFTWSGDICTVTGSATGYGVNILVAPSDLPVTIVPDDTYYIKYKTTDARVRLRIIWWTAEDEEIRTDYFVADAQVTVPATAERWTVGLFINNDVTLTDAVTVSGIAMLNAMSNAELADEIIDELNTSVSNTAGEIVSGLIDKINSVPEWRLRSAIDLSTGAVIDANLTPSSTSAAMIAIPSGMDIHIHGASRIATYDKTGEYISGINPLSVDTTITSEDAAYVRVQYLSLDLSVLRFYVAYYYTAHDEAQALSDKINTACDGVQYPGSSIASSVGNPVKLTDCDINASFEVFDVENVTSGENIVICGKNIFALRHASGIFTRNGVSFQFNTIRNTIRIFSEGATAATTSAFPDFGDDFKTVNGVTFYHNFKFRFPVDTRVSVTENADGEVTFDYGIQMRIYDGGATYIPVGTGGTSFVAEGGTEYCAYLVVQEGWAGDITYSPQIEINPCATAYEVFNGIKAPLLTTGDENVFTCGGTLPGRYTALSGKLVSLFNSETNEVYINSENDTANNILIYDTTKDGLVNGVAYNYICKFTPGNVPVFIKAFDKQYAHKIFAQVYDGTQYHTDYTGDGVYFLAESGKEYAFRMAVCKKDPETVHVNAIFHPVIATGIYALKAYGSRQDKTVIYTDKSSTITVRQRQISTKAKAAISNNLHTQIMTLTGGHISTPLAQINKRGPMVSFIDDDTWNLYCVQRYHDIFAAKGVVGGYALITENMVTNPSTLQPADPDLLPTLLDYEEEGFAVLYHCHDQNGANTRYWIKGDPTYDQDKIKDNFMDGLRDMATLGFSNYKYWVTPYGVNDKFIQDLAKNHGMQCLFNCPNKYEQQGFVAPSGNVSRWNIPRAIFGNYSYNDDLLHRVIQGAKAANGWAIIVSHVNAWGADGSETNITLGNRLTNIIQYCIDEGLEIVPATVGFEEYRAMFLMNELF